jgi:hypothetical protein
MAEIFVEQRGQQYVALRDKVIVATGTTQHHTADRAHQMYPQDSVSVEGVRDKWRVVHRGEVVAAQPDRWWLKI